MGKEEKTSMKEQVNHALENIREFCLNHQKTIAVAESVSSGYLQSIFGRAEQAGLFYQGGMTVYNCDQKSRQLNISRKECEPCNGVSPTIAKELAIQICKIFNCEITISLTGYASPIPEQDIYDLFAFGAIVMDGQVVFCEKIESQQEDADRIREDYAMQMILECAKLIEERKS